MEPGPPLQVVRGRVRVRRVEARAAVVGPRPDAVVIRPFALRAVVVSGEVEQLAPYLFGGEAEERPRRVGLDGLQGAEQADQGILEDVLGVDPAATLRSRPTIFRANNSRRPWKPRMSSSRAVRSPPLYAVDPLDELGCLGGRIGHGSNSEHLDADVATNGLKRAGCNHV